MHAAASVNTTSSRRPQERFGMRLGGMQRDLEGHVSCGFRRVSRDGSHGRHRQPQPSEQGRGMNRYFM